MPPSTRGNPKDERKTAQEGPNRARDNRPGMAQETQPRSLPSCWHFSLQLASPRLRLVPRAIRCALRLLSQGVGDASRRGGHTLRKLPKATRVRTSPKSIPPSNISKGGAFSHGTPPSRSSHSKPPKRYERRSRPYRHCLSLTSSQRALIRLLPVVC